MAYLSLLGTENLNENKDSIPSGLIATWSGSSSNIPEGWVLCNGENNTPDLRDRFVLGAGSSYNVGTTGGETTHTLTVSEMPSHTHGVSVGSSSVVAGSGASSTSAVRYSSSSTTKSTGGGSAHNNMPPYYALCYIMKT